MDLLLDKGVPAGTGALAHFSFVVSADDDQTNLYVMFRARPAGSSDCGLYVVASNDGGEAFSDAVPLATGSASGIDVPQAELVAQGSEVHVHWTEVGGGGPATYYQRSLDAGATYLPTPLRLNSAPTGQGCSIGLPQVAISDDRVAVAWSQSPGAELLEEIHLRASSDGESPFGPERLVGMYNPGTDRALVQDLVFSDDALVAVWSDTRDGSAEFFTSASRGFGANLSTDEQLTFDGGAFGFARLLADKNRVIAN